MSDTKEEAMSRFLALIGECREESEKISQLIEDHLGQSPDNINWTNVGDAGRLLEHLKEITEIFAAQIPQTK